MDISYASVVGLLAAGILEILKRIPRIPVVAHNAPQLRTIATGMVFVANLYHAITTNNLDALNLAANTIASYLASWATYKGLLSGWVKRES